MSKRQLPWAAVCCALIAGAAVATVGAQSAPTTLRRPIVKWFGPYAITANDTTRFNYSNLGVDAVQIEWAFTNALTGDMVCGNIGKPTTIAAGKGAIWDYSQTIDPTTGQEVAHCDGDRVVNIEPGETYFDATGRHGLIAWIFMEHATRRGVNLAVDLPTVEVFNSMKAKDPAQSTSFGRIVQLLYANPTAPNDFLLQRVLGGGQ